MSSFLLGFHDVDATNRLVVGGKGAQLAELFRLQGLRVPDGFCISTDAFRRVADSSPGLSALLDELAELSPQNGSRIKALSLEIRQAIESAAIPADIIHEIADALSRFDEGAAFAVRSSATAEDSVAHSFAGQHDTYLNVVGSAAILQHVSRCFASLFTERAVTYRLRNGFDHREVTMAAVVQQMVFPRAAGVLFTVDPVTSNRKVSAIEAVFGLGETLVSSQVNADAYTVRDGVIVAKEVATKRRAVHALLGGGISDMAIDSDQMTQPALADTQVLRLAELGRGIEAHFGRPQDVEWCLVDDDFHIVQSRPITNLFPIPAADDGENHVYVSVGHGQMMTDPMKPLGLSFFQLTALPRMYEAGGRLFVDVTERLGSPSSRSALLEVMGRSDPLIRDALQTIIDRGDFIPALADVGPSGAPPGPATDVLETDAAIVTDLIGRNQASVATLKREIRSKTGPALLDFILEDIKELKRILFDPQSHQVFMSAMEASWWLNEHLQEWLGEKNVADTLTQSVPNNITSEMGRELLDVADVIRPHPAVVAFLEHLDSEVLLDELPKLAGGQQARDAIQTFLDKYGMRCVGEIDITRARWSEHPTTLVPVILGNIRNFEPGAGERRFEQGRQEALTKEQEVVERLRALPDGDAKADEAQAMICRVRTYIGYREYPKYGIVSRYSVYKEALLDEAARLVQAHVLREREDIFYLTFQELHDVARTSQVDDLLIRQRKDAFIGYQALTPPRVLTSDGEAVAGVYRRVDVPTGALVGLPVSAGTAEGRARVILDMAEADLETGDILVTAYTDPSWTPVFVAIKGMVTEVGGLMTHGAVIAREYGLPAVVGVQGATRLIADGQRIRVHGTEGYVEILFNE
jgi:phosphoenolpyruvate synthase/pyruvate phosphate dikinase